MSGRTNVPDHLRRSLSEPVPDAGTVDTIDQGILPEDDPSFTPQTPRAPRHMRSMSDTGPGALRTRLSRRHLSEIRENVDDQDGHLQGGRPGNLSSGQTDAQQRVNEARVGVRYAEEPSEPRGSERLGESSMHRRPGASSEQSSDKEVPPSYRTRGSISARSRRTYISP